MDDIIVDFVSDVDSVAYVEDRHYAIQNHLPLDFRPFPEITKIHIFLETSNWNQPIYVHSDLKLLTIGGCASFNQPLDLRHCDSLGLELYDLMAFNQAIHFPHTVIENVIMCNCPLFNQPLDLSHMNLVNKIELIGMHGWNQPLCLPHVCFLVIESDTFNQPIEFEKGMGSTITLDLESASAFNQPILFEGQEIITIKLGDSFNQPLDLTECTNLCNLSVGNSFNQPITFPSVKAGYEHIRLTDLELGHSFQQPLDLSSVNDLYYLAISPHYQPLPDLSHTQIMKRNYRDKIHVDGLRYLFTDHRENRRDRGRNVVQYMKDHQVSLRHACRMVEAHRNL